MPELPETETIATDLNGLVAMQVIKDARALRPDVLRGCAPRDLSRRLSNRVISRVWRRAKTVVFDLDDGQRLLVQPRFTGVLRAFAEAQPDDPPYACTRLTLTESVLVYIDVRRLGTFTVATADEFLAFDRSLGIEPLDPEFTAARLSGIVRASEKSIKGLLMDQNRIAGCGNIYANEALWGAQIDPSRPGSSISMDEAERLRAALVDVLRASIEARGTTFRDYRDANGERGGFAKRLAAYGRAGAPCKRCGSRLVESHAVDGRSTVFCFRCQQ
ncbi:MAG: bifunctional DNA-formamidopyrimidine glycosylase/DNA-(apurinic or apyrimidinic site) lyase [Gemmatimonadaceae bacterium]